MPGFHFQLYIKNLCSENEDQVADLCFAAGASGVCENLQFRQPDANYTAEIIETKSKDLIVYFETAPPSNGLIEDIRAVDAQASVSFEKQENQDWLELWKKGYEPMQLVGNIWIVPKWSKAEFLHVKPIFMEPGMAFGTGTHETTQLVSELLPQLLKNYSRAKVLDVGTGTGILAMVAALLGEHEILGIDNDAIAVEVAQENVSYNHLQKQIAIEVTPLAEITGEYDLVIANIIDGVLQGMRPDFLRLLKKGSCLVLSGILQEREKVFLERFLVNKDFELLQRNLKGEWVSLVIKKL